MVFIEYVTDFMRGAFRAPHVLCGLIMILPLFVLLLNDQHVELLTAVATTQLKEHEGGWQTNLSSPSSSLAGKHDFPHNMTTTSGKNCTLPHKKSARCDEPVSSGLVLPLELIHVPKTGGTTLMAIAAKHNVSWSACHYFSSIQEYIKGNGAIQCPDHGQTSLPPPHHPTLDVSWWHLPLSMHDNDQPLWALSKSFFLVVRNPYTRIMSQWNYWNPGGPSKKNDARFMNTALVQILQQVYSAQHNLEMICNTPNCSNNTNEGASIDLLKTKKAYYQWDAHYIPQADYLVPNVTILRMETLSQDFANMVQGRSDDLSTWKFPAKRINPGDGRLTVANLTATTREWITKLYRKDFETFGYSLDAP